MNFQSHTAGKSTQELKHEVERLSLICEALWELLKEKHGLEDIDLIERMTHLDLMDGKYDGKKVMPSEPVKCRRCGRIMASQHLSCLYCGETRMLNPF